VFFADEATALAAGYRPCGTCMREEYRAWVEQSLRTGQI
jgi:methylphosphotriester-DNA--protein-cysteine methyltransferase